MRVLALGVLLTVVAPPCFAQTVLKSEPFVLAPYEIAFVQDASCPAGKVLKVTGAIRGLPREGSQCARRSARRYRHNSAVRLDHPGERAPPA